MPFELDLTTVAGPDTVLGAIRAEASYWQESTAPEEVRGLAAFGVDVRIDGYRFELSLKDLHRDPPASEYVLRGEVTPLAAGGSRVRARAAFGSHEWIIFGLFAALAIWMMLSGQPIAGLIVFVVSWGIGAYRMLRRAVLTRESDAGLQHLADRLELALRAADRHGARDVS